MKAVQTQSQAIGEFLEWLGDEKDICMAQRHQHTDGCLDEDLEVGCGYEDDELIYVHIGIEKLLAEYFSIDLDKVEQEKRAMLEEIRASRDECEEDITPCPHCHCMTHTVALDLCGKCGKSKSQTLEDNS